MRSNHSADLSTGSAGRTEICKCVHRLTVNVSDVGLLHYLYNNSKSACTNGVVPFSHSELQWVHRISDIVI